MIKGKYRPRAATRPSIWFLDPDRHFGSSGMAKVKFFREYQRHSNSFLSRVDSANAFKASIKTMNVMRDAKVLSMFPCRGVSDYRDDMSYHVVMASENGGYVPSAYGACVHNGNIYACTATSTSVCFVGMICYGGDTMGVVTPRLGIQVSAPSRREIVGKMSFNSRYILSKRNAHEASTSWGLNSCQRRYPTWLVDRHLGPYRK